MAAKTKAVDGQDLKAGDFAFVGDPQDIETWHLPIHDCPDAQNAMARFNQVQGIPADEKKSVARKISNKAKSCGFDTSNFDDEHGLRAQSIEECRATMQKLSWPREHRERGKVQLRAAGDGRTLEMFIPYQSESIDMGFRERIDPGAFTRSIRAGRSQPRNDIFALWSHDSSQPLARQANGTLEFEERDSELFATATLNPDIDYHARALKTVGAGLVRGTSFGFETIRDQWDYEGDETVRTLLEVRLFEVSPVVFPAYEESEIQARSAFAQIRSGTGLEVEELLVLLRDAKAGKVAVERREQLAGWIGKLQAMVPDEVELASNIDVEHRLRRLATFDRKFGLDGRHVA